MSILDDIGTHLTSEGVVGGATGWTLRKGISTATPDQIVVVSETGGFGVDQYSNPPVGDPSFQILVRAASRRYDLARTQIGLAFTALNQGTVSGYLFIHALSAGPLSLGFDANDRPLLTWNFRARKEALS